MRWAVWLGAAAAAVGRGDACTTVAISGAAQEDGSAMCMQTVDCSECDARVALVPGRVHAPGTMHPVYGVGAMFPRMKSDRATIYQDVPDGPVPLAFIPEAERTFGVFEASYALMNEHGLTLGESSCSSKIPAAGVDMADPSTGKLGKAYFSIAALMQLGLERCETARCAIATMGGLSEQYGFYGESFMGAEALSIADTSGEAWIFHIMQDHSTNVSAIWAAQRVPDGHIAVVANEFIIKTIPEGPHPDFMHSPNMRSEAIAAGFWNGSGAFDFQQVYGTKTVVGDNLYATVRQQWIYSQAAPSLKLALAKSPSGYAFSYPVDAKLSIEAAIELLRGHYAGTEWDLTKGIVAGPFGNPKRVEGGLGMKAVPGMMPRPISIQRTSQTHVGVASKKAPVALYGPDEPSTTVFAPFFAETLRQAATVPLEKTAALYSRYYQVGRRDQFAYKQSAWWAFDAVANLCNLYYSNMTQMHVFPAVKLWQAKMLDVVRRGDVKAAVKAQDALVDAWWDLYDTLLVTYNDGTYNYYPGHDPKKPYAAIGYPEGWLRDIGFDSDFWKVQTVQGQIKKACKKNESERSAPNGDGALAAIDAEPSSLWVVLATHALTLSLGLALGALLRGLCTRRVQPAANKQPLLAATDI